MSDSNCRSNQSIESSEYQEEEIENNERVGNEENKSGIIKQKEDNKVVYSRQNEKRNKMIDLHVRLWTKHTNQEAKFTLWFELFTPENRAFLWNSLDFPLYYFKSLSKEALHESKNTTKDNPNCNSYRILQQTSNFEIYQIAKIIIGKNINRVENVTKDKISIKIQKKLFKSCNSSKEEVNDFKSQLWIPLSLKQKFELYIKCKREREQDLLSFMFLHEFKLMTTENDIFYHKEIENISKFDKFIECTLDNLTYEKFTQLCEIQVLKARINKVDGYKNIQLEDQEKSYSFAKFLVDTNEKCQKLIVQKKLARNVAMKYLNFKRS